MDPDDGRQRVATLCHASAQVAQRVPERRRRRGRSSRAELALDPLAVGVGRQRNAATGTPVLALAVPEAIETGQGRARQHSKCEERCLAGVGLLAARLAVTVP
jgi:hypothetical protein